ncbi:MAG: helix-turn-helix domain-containing protein, partial [bacterium]
MEALAERSGLSRATGYRRTGGREALVAALEARGVDAKPGADARGRILAAARTVFAKTGFESATIEEIAAEASLGAATVYRCFGDKDSLVAAFLDERG